jgi:hypothetical protein
MAQDEQIIQLLTEIRDSLREDITLRKKAVAVQQSSFVWQRTALIVAVMMFLGVIGFVALVVLSKAFFGD